MWFKTLVFQIEEKEAAQVFEDFVASFEGADKGGKAFVRGSTITPGSTGKTLCIHACLYVLCSLVLIQFICTRSELASLCLLYTSPSPRDATLSRMPSSA